MNIAAISKSTATELITQIEARARGRGPRRPIVIATRKSRLAMWQSQLVRSNLVRLNVETELLGVSTSGDRNISQSLSKIGGKGLFIKELELALLECRADIAVHSLKDLPMDLAGDLMLIATLEREDPRDAWISDTYQDWRSLPQGAVVGTSSSRRQAMLAAHRPDLIFKLLRGNLDTRLRKLDEGNYDGIILAAAGLHRLGQTNRIAKYFSINEMLPAAAQGIIAIEIRSDDSYLAPILRSFNHKSTWLIAHAERAVSRALGGNCSMTLAAYAVLDGTNMLLTAAWRGEGSTAPLRYAKAEQSVETVEEAESLGLLVAEKLRSATDS
jgi:hydroxymethylbilane synthase